MPIEEGLQVKYNTMISDTQEHPHPQATSDPLDPLNWSSFRKHTILAIVMLKYEIKNSVEECSFVSLIYL